jgi:hypothetical protein
MKGELDKIKRMAGAFKGIDDPDAQKGNIMERLIDEGEVDTM